MLLVEPSFFSNLALKLPRLFCPPAGKSPFLLSDLQTQLNHWGASYFTDKGKQPLLYVVVLLYSLQFTHALAFLARDELTKSFR